MLEPVDEKIMDEIINLVHDKSVSAFFYIENVTLYASIEETMHRAAIYLYLA